MGDQSPPFPPALQPVFSRLADGCSHDRRQFLTMLTGCRRVVPVQELLACLKQLLLLDRSWLPAQEGFSLYVRPFAFASCERPAVRAAPVRLIAHLRARGICLPGGRPLRPCCSASRPAAARACRGADHRCHPDALLPRPAPAVPEHVSSLPARSGRAGRGQAHPHHAVHPAVPGGALLPHRAVPRLAICGRAQQARHAGRGGGAGCSLGTWVQPGPG